jgi:hypothetical protein
MMSDICHLLFFFHELSTAKDLLYTFSAGNSGLPLGKELMDLWEKNSSSMYP